MSARMFPGACAPAIASSRSLVLPSQPGKTAQRELAAARDGGGSSAGLLRALTVGATRQPAEALGAKNLPDGRIGKGRALFLKDPFNFVDRVLLFAQRDQEPARGVLFGLGLRAGSQFAEEFGLVLAELVAENAERSR